jgi:hypothetical protein
MFGLRPKQENVSAPPQEEIVQVTFPGTHYEPECAWCMAEQNQAMGGGSHGICTFHSEQAYQTYSANRRH